MLTFAVVIASCGVNKFEQEVVKEKSAIKLARETKRGNYSLITTEELKVLFDKKSEYVLIDAMPYKNGYQKMHISGAKQFLFPIQKMEKWNPKETENKSKEDYINLLGEDKEKLIIVYCGFVKCTRSHNAAIWAKKLGYKNVKRYAGGIYAWKGAGHKTESIK